MIGHSRDEILKEDSRHPVVSSDGSGSYRRKSRIFLSSERTPKLFPWLRSWEGNACSESEDAESLFAYIDRRLFYSVVFVHFVFLL